MSAAPIVLKNLRFKVVFFKNVIINQEERRKECTAQSVAKTKLKTERIENYGERQIYIYSETITLI